MAFTYPMELYEMDYGPVFGYLDKGHVNRKAFATVIDWEWEARVDDLSKIEHRLARWLPPNPDGLHELVFVGKPGFGVFQCTFVSRENVHYPD